MSPLTISEKILSERSGTEARAGSHVVCDVDVILGTDAATPMALDYLAEMGGGAVAQPERVLLAFDHYAPPTSPATTAYHERLRTFAGREDIRLHDVGEGISHQIAAECGAVAPGDLVVGADSHTVTLGALNALATGVGSSDLAAALLTGQVWLRVPETIRVELVGSLGRRVSAKDAALELASRLGSAGASYATLEYAGEGVGALGMDERFVLANLAVESGAKAAIFGLDEVARAYLDLPAGTSGVAADAGAAFTREISLDLGALTPRVARPGDPTDVVGVHALADVPIDFVFLGTCSGGRAGDFRRALEVIESGGGVADGVHLVVTPASRRVRDELEADGTLGSLAALGATITLSGCGPCCGTSPPIPHRGARVLSTANRNFAGRMGASDAAIYLASPETCAAAAVSGRIADPREP